MSRIHGPKCKLCRRAGVKLYLKGTRCDTEKCAMNKRPYAPGQHGSRRSRKSEYAEQLREKQKAKWIYGIMERQFRRYVAEAMDGEGVAGENLYRILESRIDNVVYRSGLAVSRAQARQMVRSGLFMVNDKVVMTPSLMVGPGDVIKPVDFSKVHLREGFVLPEWISANVKERYVKYERIPTMEDFNENYEVQPIIDFYSR
ncbi:30S ribosomal protein S4 [candidate division WWE3 bacterium]|nr:30S ribosomal protein S4 [candidate division WWE3 bacterium]